MNTIGWVLNITIFVIFITIKNNYQHILRELEPATIVNECSLSYNQKSLPWEFKIENYK